MLVMVMIKSYATEYSLFVKQTVLEYSTYRCDVGDGDDDNDD
jgi:hypothetical protein